MQYIVVSAVFFMLLFDKLNIFFYILLSSFLHECGHILVCLLFGIKPKITISPFGIKLSNYPNDSRKKVLVAAAGPAVNLILVILSVFYLNYNFSLYTYIFLSVNLILFFFNILPVNFLDGGQIVSCFYDNPKCVKILDIISFLLVIFAVIYFSQNKSFSLVMVCVFLAYYFINKFYFI